MLKNYIHKLSNLRTDKNRNRYPAYTSYRAPHKPFLLLSIMDLIAQGLIAENFIEPSFELLDTFNTYWNSIMPLGSKTSMAYPFHDCEPMDSAADAKSRYTKIRPTST